MYFLPSLLGVAALAAAAPNPALGPLQSALCALDNAIISKLTAIPTARSSALAFCSSFISIPPVTTTVVVATVTPLTTVTETTSTAYITQTNPPVTTTSTAALDARGLPAIVTPSALKVLASSAISRVCSCISSQIPLATTTIASTSTAPTSTLTATPTGTCLATPISNAKMHYFCGGGNNDGVVPPSYLDIGTTCPGVCYDISAYYHLEDSYSSYPAFLNVCPAGQQNGCQGMNSDAGFIGVGDGTKTLNCAFVGDGLGRTLILTKICAGYDYVGVVDLTGVNVTISSAAAHV